MENDLPQENAPDGALPGIYERLKKTEYPVAFGFFTEEQAPPYIIFVSPRAAVFFADGEAYYQTPYVQVELYTRCRDLKAELAVEAQLGGLSWDKDTTYLEKQDIYQTIYTMEV